MIKLPFVVVFENNWTFDGVFINTLLKKSELLSIVFIPKGELKITVPLPGINIPELFQFPPVVNVSFAEVITIVPLKVTSSATTNVVSVAATVFKVKIAFCWTSRVFATASSWSIIGWFVCFVITTLSEIKGILSDPELTSQFPILYQSLSMFPVHITNGGEIQFKIFEGSLS